jgi:outer membrane protein OmpA-like peptidoglycan-associated protein
MKKICCFFVIVIGLLSCHTGLAAEKMTALEWLERGVELEKQNVYEEAVRMYTNAIMADRNFAEAYFRRAKASLASHKTNAMEALTDFNKALALDPTNAEAYYQRGLLHSFILNNEHARDDMKTAANLGHKGAQKWLAPDTKAGEKESAAMKVPEAVSRTDAPVMPAGGTDEKSTAVEGRNLELGEYLSSTREPMVHFDFNMATIKEPYYAVLDEIARVLIEKIPDANIVLAGHTDSTGTEKYNDGLSLRRAKAVESYLSEKHEISLDRITVKGYGESTPIATNETDEGRARNRRVELKIAEQ